MDKKDIKTNWDLNVFFSGNNDKNIEKDINDWKKSAERFIDKWIKCDDYLSSAEVLKNALDDFEKWNQKFGSVSNAYYYFWLKRELMQDNPEIKAKMTQLEDVSKDVENRSNFFLLKISRIDKNLQMKLIKDKRLSDYKHFLEKLFKQSKHLLSEQEERIMNLKSTSSYSNWVKTVSEFISKEEIDLIDENNNVKKCTMSEIFSLMKSPQKRIRDDAAVGLNNILEKHIELAEAEINSILNDKKVNDMLRKHDRPDGERFMRDDIDEEVVDSLVKSVTEGFDISRKFYSLKAKLLGLKRLEYHERNVDYVIKEKIYEFDKSVELVLEVMDGLDNQFSEIFIGLIKNGQVDAFPKKSKRNGAFCVHFLRSQPTFVLLNHTNKLDDVTTLAHEIGHAINNEMMKIKQNSLNFDTTLATAEVASTFFEDFVIDRLLIDADSEMKLSLLVRRLDNDVSTILRQVACINFERELHLEYRKKGYLSKEEIGSIFAKNMHAYMGDSVEQSKGSQNWWIYWGHIRRYFYNYSYASGSMISKALQKMVREDKNNIEKVKTFLSAGTSKSPREIFSDLGIDITDENFWKLGISRIRESLKECKNLAKKLGKI